MLPELQYCGLLSNVSNTRKKKHLIGHKIIHSQQIKGYLTQLSLEKRYFFVHC